MALPDARLGSRDPKRASVGFRKLGVVVTNLGSFKNPLCRGARTESNSSGATALVLLTKIEWWLPKWQRIF